MPLRLPSFPGARRSVALIITLAILTIVSMMLIGFVLSTREDRGATQSYSDALRADQLALGGLDAAVASVRAEILNPSISTNFTSSGFTISIPISATNATPQHTATNAVYPLIKISGGASFSSNGVNITNIPSVTSGSTTNLSANSRRVSLTRWNKPQLVPTASASLFPVPSWVVVGRKGPFAPSGTNPSTIGCTPGLNSTNEVLGRFAYVVYDTSGLLDINVAGAPSGASGTRGLMPWVDLSQISTAAALTNVSGLIRNKGTATAFSTYVTNTWAANGFISVTNGDTTFLSRQDLIRYSTNNPSGNNFSAALPYLTVFSRELNGPTWGPGLPSGIGYTNSPAYNDGTATNFFFPAVRVAAAGWNRDNSIPSVAGEPLVKYRFPLDQISQLQAAAASPGANAAVILKYFGLVQDTSAAAYKRWIYTNPAGGSASVSSIKLLSAISGREPDFFELLKATILQSSIGLKGRNDDLAGSAVDPDPVPDNQIIQIGLNIIDQAGTDDLPSTVVFNSLEFYGVKDLPYISQVFVGCLPDGSPPITSTTAYFFFNLWNPHQQTTVAASLPKLQLIALPTGGNDYTLQYGVSSADMWTASASGSLSSLTPIAIPTGTDYRSPALLSGGTGGNATLNSSANAFSVSVPLPANADQTVGASHTQWNAVKADPTKWGFFLSGINNGITFALQYQDPVNNKWHTYSTFAGKMQNSGTAIQGLKFGSVVTPLQLNNGSTAAATVLANSYYFTKSDPRTARWAASWNETAYSSLAAGHAIGGTNFKVWRFLPSFGTVETVPPTASYDVSQWASNTNTFTYADPDTVKRPGDYATGGTPYPTTFPPSPDGRPLVMERPYASVGELGYVFRDLPWKSLDFSSTSSADAGLLDVFTVADGTVRRTVSGQEWIIAGRVNPNSPLPNVLGALLSGAAANPTNFAQTTITNTTATNAFTTRSALVTQMMNSVNVGGANGANSTSKTVREGLVRALAESSNTRTWNLLIDVIAQAGHYPPSATTFDNFIVTGERRYWLHVAIDRYTGEIVDEQLEVVTE